MAARVVVVGGGAAGIIAAWRAASLGAEVILLEKTDRLGTKILISGGGKCNITHDGPVEDVLRAFRTDESRFLRPSCYRFTNREVVEMLARRGLDTYTRPDGRIFPVSQTAKDVLAILRSYLHEAGVRVRTESPCTGVDVRDGQVEAVRFAPVAEKVRRMHEVPGGYQARTASNLLRELDPSEIASLGEEAILPCAHLVLAAGGSSYPASGTTGDGWAWVRDAGHRVTPIRPALAPLYLADHGERAAWSGISLQDVVLKARQAREIARWRGDLLFTHQGLSGPCALGISRAVAEARERGDVSLEIDLAPDQDHEALVSQILEAARSSPHRTLGSWAADLLPERMVPAFLEGASLSEPSETGMGSVSLGRLPKRARNLVLEAAKSWKLGPVRAVPLEKGEVVAGGVSLNEIDSRTMRSSIVKGLYLCGEMLDIAGPIGGYNLQAAFSTGFVAGDTAAKDALGLT